ncbi:hypothetical protein [Nitrosomonas sp. Nm132]|uniref:hypothetical protein n=1 Tax=Nitrosomonas sp. Nm132 TaxID=1881053 RepID=UPI00088C637D|nr:hypothetical protein [Nitrosomonas sp. Nm132]SDH25379.1 hypothetical protein SAMN05428952_100910 [Nitrosomonas sp. Nm132]
MQQTTQLTALKTNQLVSTPDVKVDFFSKSGFELACRISRAFATSNAVPEPFRQFNEKKDKQGNITLVENPSAIGNCLVAMEVANSVGLSVISVMQNADVIQGQLRWSAKYQIAAVNASRRFTPLKFKRQNLGLIKAKYKEKTDWNNQLRKFNYVEHDVEIENLECIAWAYELDENMRPTKEIVQSIPVTMQMAVEEGWYAKDGSKWQGAMRLQMLQYRAASFFASIYAPDVIMGMGRSSEEARDIIDVTPQSDGSYSANVNLQDLKSTHDVGNIPATGESVDQETGEISTASQNTEQAVSEGFRNEAPGESSGAVLEQPAPQPTRQRKQIDLG